MVSENRNHFLLNLLPAKTGSYKMAIATGLKDQNSPKQSE
jgi:hypothetical protein